MGFYSLLMKILAPEKKQQGLLVACMSGAQRKSFIILGLKLRGSMAWQDYGDKYVEFCDQAIDYNFWFQL